MLKFAQVLQKLLSGYKQVKGVDATGLDLLKLRMQAAERVRESQKIVPFKYKKGFGEEVDELIKKGDVTLGTAAKTTKKKPPVDPKFEEAVKKQDNRRRDLKDWEGRLKTKLERENKEGAFKIAYNKYLNVDKKPMKMEEIITTYKNLNKYPKGRQYIWGDISEIEKGEMFTTMGERSRKQLVDRLNKMVNSNKDPFKKPVKEPTGQLEMDFTDWDDKGMAGGGLAYMLGQGGPVMQGGGLNYLGKQPEVTTPKKWKSSPDHPDTELAYITEPEKKVLIALNMHGGLEDGKPNKGPNGIISLQGDLGGYDASPGGPNDPSGGEDQEEEVARMERAMIINKPPTSGPKHGGGEGSWMDFIPGIGMARRAARFLGPMGDERNLALRHDFLKKEGYLGEGEEDEGRFTSEYLKSPEGLAELKGMGYKTVDDFQPGGKYYHEGSERYPYPQYAQQGSSLGLDSIQSKNKDDFDLYAVVEGREPSRYYADGGRIGFDKGGMSRRNFLKLMGGLASVPILGKYFKFAKPAAKAVKAVEASNAAGMPAWFPKLVDKVIKEGKDMGGTVERQIVKEVELPGSKTKVTVQHDLNTGDTIVDIGEGKHGWADGRHGQPTRLHLQKGEYLEPAKGQKKGVKTKDEFEVEEAEFTGDAENIKYEETVYEKYGDHASDFTEVENYATGKNVDKKVVGRKREADAYAEGRAEMQAEEAAEEIDEFAQGGLAYMLGE